MGIANLRRAEFKTIGHEVADTIRHAILDGTLKPGERLVVGAIAEQMGVSRGTVREAILALEQQGLVTNEPRKGACVLHWTPTDVEELYTLREALETTAARLAAKRASPTETSAMQDLLNCMRRDTSPTLDDSIEMDLRFHALVGSASHHERLCRLLAETQMQTKLLITLTRPFQTVDRFQAPEYMQRLAENHQAILDAIKRGDADQAERSMRQHIENSGHEVVDIVRANESMKRPPRRAPIRRGSAE